MKNINKKEKMVMAAQKILGTIVLSFILTLGVYAEEEDVTEPAQDASSKTEQKDTGGKIPLEIEKAMQMTEGKERKKALYAAALEWLKKEPTAALEWAFKIARSDPSRVSLYVVGMCGENHGKITADWCLQNKKYGSLHYSMHFWATVDPTSASEWCLKAPEEVRHLLFASLGDGWTYKDPLAATAWFMGLKTESDRRSMAYGICKAWTWAHPDDVLAATAWALELKSQEERLSAIFGIGQGWCRRDLPALTAWIKALKNKGEVRAAACAVAKQIQCKNVISDKFGKDNADAFAKEWLDLIELSASEKTDILNWAPISMKDTGNVKWPQ